MELGHNGENGRVPVGVNTSDTDFATVEKTGGAKTHKHTQGITGSTTLTLDQIPKHGHQVLLKNLAASGNSIGVPYPNGSDFKPYTGENGGGKGHTHTNPDTATSSSIQPYITCYMWKRTA